MTSEWLIYLFGMNFDYAIKLAAIDIDHSIELINFKVKRYINKISQWLINELIERAR